MSEDYHRPTALVQVLAVVETTSRRWSTLTQLADTWGVPYNDINVFHESYLMAIYLLLQRLSDYALKHVSKDES